MFQCPKCNEVIGDRLPNCPFCNYEITLADVRKARSQEEDLHKEATEKMKAMWKRRRAGMVLLFFVWFAGTILLAACFMESLAFTGAIILPLLVGFAITKITGAGRCPYCDRLIYQRGAFLFTHNCPLCGGTLR